MSTFIHNGVQSTLNEEKPPWNNIEPSIFFDEAKCGLLLMLYCIIVFCFLFVFKKKLGDWFPTLIRPLCFT